MHFAVALHREFARCCDGLGGWQKFEVRWRHYSIHEGRLFSRSYRVLAVFLARTAGTEWGKYRIDRPELGN